MDFEKALYGEGKNSISALFPDERIHIKYIDETRYDLSEEDRKLKIFFYGISWTLAIIELAVILNSTVTAILYRKREFAMLRAIGMTGWQLKSQLFWECGLILLFGTILGLIIGGTASRIMIFGMEKVNFHITYSFSKISLLLVAMYGGVILAVTHRSLVKMEKNSILENLRHL